MTNWYIADTHFGHENIIKLCNRDFASVEAMDQELVFYINDCVGPDDDLWVIGDFSCNKRAKDGDYLSRIFNQINGRKHLIIGNHDTKKVLELPWVSIQQQVQIKDGEHTFFLNHYPMITWPGARYGCIQLFGHIHNNWLGSRNSLNLSVEHWAYGPINAREIMNNVSELPINPLWSQVEPECEI